MGILWTLSNFSDAELGIYGMNWNGKKTNSMLAWDEEKYIVNEVMVKERDVIVHETASNAYGNEGNYKSRDCEINCFLL